MSTEAHIVVLLVETEDEFRADAADALERTGFRVIACAGSHEALDVIDGPEKIDVLLTRVRMPEKCPHGFALARMAQLKRPGIRAIHYARSRSDLPDFEIEAAGGVVYSRPAHGAGLVALVRESDFARPQTTRSTALRGTLPNPPGRNAALTAPVQPSHGT
jgi:CheY-like chemotaxis protein